MTPNSAPRTPASAKARSRYIVLPRPPAAARIVGDVGEAQRGQRPIARRRERLFDHLLDRGQLWIKPGAVVPAVARDLTGQPRCRLALALARGDDDRQAVLRRIGIREPAHRGHVDNCRADLLLASLPERDHLGIGT